MDWHCEADSHAARSPSPHGINRICSNNLLADHADPEDYPVGAASVKELYDDLGQTIVGYAVNRRMTAGTDDAAWFYYERVPLDHPAPHDANGVVALGTGDTAAAAAICVGCHNAAGSDVDHPGQDNVYTRVPADPSQTPPVTGETSLSDWLTAGHYLNWACESTVHDQRSPSPHGKNRICSNALLSGHGTADEYPVGAAAVKELYNPAGDTVTGYAVSRHTSAGTTGANWYWAIPGAVSGVGLPGSGAEMMCVGCHTAAGSDAQHSGHDMVYVQVTP